MLAINIAGNEHTHKRTNERTYRQSSGFEFNQQETICRGSPSGDAKSSREKSQNEAKPSHNNGKAARAELRRERRTAYDRIESNNKRNSCTHKEKFQEQTA